MGATMSKQDAFVAAAPAGDDSSGDGAGRKTHVSSVDGKENTNLYHNDDDNDDDDDAADTCCVGTAGTRTSSSLPDASATSPPQRSTPRTSALPKPKSLLFGCTNAQEHYQYIVDVCERVEHLRGAEGLRELGLEYRMVHDPFNCQCEGIDWDDMADSGPGEMSSVAFDELDPRLWEEEEKNSNKDEENTEPLLLDKEEEYMVPIGTPLADTSVETATTMTYATMASHEDLPQDNITADTLTKSRLEDMNKEDDIALHATTLTTSPSNVSLFSLATHHTWLSAEDREDAMELEHGCALRLVHVPPPVLDACRPPTLIEADNYETFIANGKMYDEAARLCMEYAQDLMVDEGDMEWVTICEERSISALVSRGYWKQKRNHRPTLLIITGKGKVSGGIFSRRHIITTGIEASTALPMIREARSRNMDVVILDPNARGDVNGMDTVDASLRKLFDGERGDDVYVIAHSMAGAQIVRYLHGDKQVGAPANSKGESEGVERLALFRSVKAVVFTDGNHNVNWTKNNPKLTAMLEGPACLYIKSHKLHQDEPKELGALHEECSFWTHRFGKIRTIWAGTHEHALTNFTARNYMWEHFDSFLGKVGKDNQEGGEEEEGEKAPSF